MAAVAGRGARGGGDEGRQTVAQRAREESCKALERQLGMAATAASAAAQRRRTGRSVDTDSKTEQAQAVAEKPAAAETKPADARQAEAPARRRRQTKVDLAHAQEMSIAELTKIAKSLDVPGATGMRKQELIFQILRCARREERATSSRKACLESAARRLRLPPRPRTTTTCPAPTTSTSPPPRSASSTCRPGDTGQRPDPAAEETASATSR